jgi:hypothetical protein
MDNQGWMPRHVSHSLKEGDNLRLMQSVLGPACMLMGSARKAYPGSGTQGSVEAQSEGVPTSRRMPAEVQPLRQGRQGVHQ